MILTRRAFLRLATGLPFLDLMQFVAPAPQAKTREGNPWQFPLQFPAYFVKESPRKRHVVYIPLVTK